MIRKLQISIILLCTCMCLCAQESISIDDVDPSDIDFTERIIDIVLNPIDFTGLTTFEERVAKVEATCAANSYRTGTKVSFDVSNCAGPILLSPYINRSLLPDPTVPTGDEILLTWPYKFQFNIEGRYFVHCGTQFKSIATCVDIRTPEAIPDLSWWSMIILLLAIGTIATIKIRGLIYTPQLIASTYNN